MYTLFQNSSYLHPTFSQSCEIKLFFLWIHTQQNYIYFRNPSIKIIDIGRLGISEQNIHD